MIMDVGKAWYDDFLNGREKAEKRNLMCERLNGG